MYHKYHILDVSPWPLLGSMGAFTLTSGTVMYMHNYVGGFYTLTIGFTVVLFTMIFWWRDVIRESTFQGNHTIFVQNGLKYGMILFILSEVLFFAAFFWAFFHSSLSPTVELGAVWPPKGIHTLNAWEVPLLNTIILLSSGATVTASHHAIISNKRFLAIFFLFLTILLAVIFTILQGYEYMEAPFTISDSIYGTTFFMATGFHGFHVIIGTIFLTVTLVRLYYHHFSTHHLFGFEAAAWYFHFVDVVWLFLFVSIYWWGS